MKTAPRYQTITGKLVDIGSPTDEMIDIADIAHALSMTCRFGGHCRDYYSVAEHSVHVVEIVRKMIGPNSTAPCDYMINQICLGALLHDATEAYLGDVISPLKELLPYYGDLETRWREVISKVWPEADHDSYLIPLADREALYHEVVALCLPSAVWSQQMPSLQGCEGKAVISRGIEIECWSPAQARRKFLNCYRSLMYTLTRR